MAFYIDHVEMTRLTSRTRQTQYKGREDGILPFLRDGGRYVYDVDDPKVQAYIRAIPTSISQARKDKLNANKEDFMRRKAKGEIVCAMTGKPSPDARSDAEDFDIDFAKLVKDAGDTELDRIKKEEEVYKLRGQNEKQQIQIKALSGGLIDRDYVAVWIQRYLGTLHTQLLDYAANSGVCDDLYGIVKRGDDSRATIKQMETALAEGISIVLKGSIDVVRKNPV